MTKNEFREILVAQNELNIKYSGARWTETVSGMKFKSAIFTEIAEFLESSPEDWKWWKNTPNDRQNQYIEVIDVVHFGASLMIKYRSIDDLVDEFEGIDKGDILRRIDDGDLYEIMYEFFQCPGTYNYLLLITAMCLFTKDALDIEEVWKGYFAKNQLNQKRIAGGYKEGNYEKINEAGEEDNREIHFEEK